MKILYIIFSIFPYFCIAEDCFDPTRYEEILDQNKAKEWILNNIEDTPAFEQRYGVGSSSAIISGTYEMYVDNICEVSTVSLQPKRINANELSNVCYSNFPEDISLFSGSNFYVKIDIGILQYSSSNQCTLLEFQKQFRQHDHEPPR